MGSPALQQGKHGKQAREVNLTAVSGSSARLPCSVSLHNDSTVLTQCPIGYRLTPQEAPYPRPNTSAESALAVATMLLCFGSALLVPYSVAAAAVCFIVYSSPTAAAYLAITLAACFVPPGQSWHAFRHWRLFDVWRRHFRMRIVTPPHPFMDCSRHYLCAQFPHACFPMACVLNPALVGQHGTGMPGGDKGMQGVVASILLQLPFFRHIFAWIGSHPADGPTLASLLKRTSVGMQPEGIVGIFSGATPAREAVFLSQRKGFVRVAIQTGVDILPVYHLGNSQVFSFWGPVGLSRRLRMSVGVFWGALGLPLPRQHDLVSLTTYPIPVQQSNNPSEEEVERVHAQVVAAITRLFDQHKHLVGWEDRQLEIV